MGWITPGIQSLYKKELLLTPKLFAVLNVPEAIFLYCIIQTTPSNAESHEDEDGSKQKIVQETMAELQVIFCVGAAKSTKNHAEKGNFPCKLTGAYMTIRTGT